MITRVLKYFFGTANQRSLQRLQGLVNKINELEASVIELQDHEFPLKTEEFKKRAQNGESLDSLLPEAFALTREAAKRVLGQRHYDVQLIGGIVLHQGKIAEMKTGEGKTLTATLPLYLNALSGKGSQLVTVNDYLARRDAEWMGTVYKFLGLTVGILQNDMPDHTRKSMYQCDILYATNSELGFDYLRDNMKFELKDYVQRELNYAIIDEVDSILIDEARTPLIISGSTEEEVTLYQQVDKIVAKLSKNKHFEIDIREKHVILTEEGNDIVEEALQIKNLYAAENIKLLHHVNQALKAHVIFHKDIEYVVWDDEILIVDEFTGRILAGRRYSDGLHQAIEAKEHVKVKKESQTLASITLQNYFRLYKKLAGMTGTAATEAEEFHKIYKLDIISIPTNQPIKRMDKPDLIFLTEKAKFKHIVDDIKERYAKGQPVLVGTVAIETSERLSKELDRANIPHAVLNAKQHQKEAEIIAHAGEKSHITIATNMAGRGTDIKLTPEARDAGGLYILGTERHESRRIDNQLRGRSGRQGDPGESRFYISLEDSLIKRFSGDSMRNTMERFGGMKEDDIIEDLTISNMIETVQEKVEKHNFEIRKHLIEYDDVLNQQRIVMYKLRRNIIIGGSGIRTITYDLIKKFIDDQVASHNTKDSFSQEIAEQIIVSIKEILGITLEDLPHNLLDAKSPLVFSNELVEYFVNFYNTKLNEISSDLSIKPEDILELKLENQKWYMLEILDQAWRQHIVDLDHIREGIGLRGYGQKTPIIEYKREAFSLFNDMSKSMIKEIMSHLFKIDISSFDKTLLEARRLLELQEIHDSLINGGEQKAVKKIISKAKKKPQK